MKLDRAKCKIFNKLLLNWAKDNLRNFSWRSNRSPYRIFVAEFLLKRTTSTAAHREYEKFLFNYPSISDISNADIDRLEDDIRPIGLYKQRTKGIKDAADYILQLYGGTIPSTFDELIKVPHIGLYTAACILSFGYDIPIPTIDSNVERVLFRTFKNIFGEKPKLKEISQIAWELLPKEEHVLFNYGLIDLGATICSYRGCNSDKCPLREICCYYNKRSVIE